MSRKNSTVDNTSTETSATALLTGRMAQGEETAYREFYDLYFNRLLRYLLVATSGNESAAKEAMQLTLTRVVRHIKPFKTGEAFWSWLTVLARSSITDEARKRNRYQSLLERFFQSRRAGDIPFSEAENRLLSLLEKQLGKLDVKERELIERKYLDGESLKEIALATGTTDRAVESRLLRIRQHLKTTLLSELKNER